MDKIELIKYAIEKADRYESKLNLNVKNVPFLGSLKIRALLNNLGELGNHFLECGSHKGGSACSAVFGNNNLKSITIVDSWESDLTNEDKAFPKFVENISTFKPEKTSLTIIQNDCFKVNTDFYWHKIDFYSYDAGHSFDDQKNALTYYYPVLADEFIYCVDDYGWPDVKKGTLQGIKECNFDVLFEKEFITNKEYDNDSWWDGYAVFLLKKKS
jgi:hypothetical protein